MEKIFVNKCSKECPKESFRIDYSSEMRDQIIFQAGKILTSLPYNRVITPGCMQKKSGF